MLYSQGTGDQLKCSYAYKYSFYTDN